MSNPLAISSPTFSTSFAPTPLNPETDTYSYSSHMSSSLPTLNSPRPTSPSTPLLSPVTSFKSTASPSLDDHSNPVRREIFTVDHTGTQTPSSSSADLSVALSTGTGTTSLEPFKPTKTARQDGLHLTPVTWQDLETLVMPADQRYEFVDGLSVRSPPWRPLHCEVISKLCQLFAFKLSDILIAPTPSHQVLFNVLYDHNGARPCIRIPDMAMTISSGEDDVAPLDSTRTAAASTVGASNAGDRRASSSPSTPSSRSTCSSEIYRRIARRILNYTKEKPADIVIEFTSKGTRDVDMSEKWIEYALVGIKIYIIIDAKDVSSDGLAHVIVGHSDPNLNANASRSILGFPERNPKWHRKSDFALLAEPHKEQAYFKTVFTGNRKVKLGPLAKLGLNADQFQNPGFLGKELKKQWNNMRLSEQEKKELMDDLETLRSDMSILNSRAQAAEKHASDERRGKNDAIRRASTAEKRASTAEKRASTAEKRASDERRGKNDAIRRANIAEKRAEEVQRAYDELMGKRATGFPDRREETGMNEFISSPGLGVGTSIDRRRTSDDVHSRSRSISRSISPTHSRSRAHGKRLGPTSNQRRTGRRRPRSSSESESRHRDVRSPPRQSARHTMTDCSRGEVTGRRRDEKNDGVRAKQRGWFDWVPNLFTRRRKD